MFYFKTEGNFGRLSDINANQLAAAQAFKEWLPGTGALIGEFDDTNDFEKKLRNSLQLYAHNFLSSRDSNDIKRVTAELGPGTRVSASEWQDLATLTTQLQALIQRYGQNMGHTIMRFKEISRPRIESQTWITSNAALVEQDSVFSEGLKNLKDEFVGESKKVQQAVQQNMQDMCRLAATGTISTKRGVSEAIMAAEEDLRKIGKIVDSFELRLGFFAGIVEGGTKTELTALSEAMRGSVAGLLTKIAEIREEMRGL